MYDLRDPAIVWETAYGELQLQLPRETFDTWLRGTRLLAYEDGTYIIAVSNIYAREWLEHRLKKVIVRTLSAIAGRSVEARFVLWTGRSNKNDSLAEAGPLLAAFRAPEEEDRYGFDPSAPEGTGLNPRYTFDTYAVGAGNRLAHAAALAVVEQPILQFNPLYIWASVGLGKTHLLHAIGNACAERGQRVLYISAERFTNDLVGAIRERETARFREKYRSVDLLLVDDIEFIAGRRASEEEFYHTFNVLYNAGAQIAVAGSQAPSSLRKLQAALRSRFEGGLVVCIQPPDLATRIQALTIKVAQRGLTDHLSPEVLETIARSAAENMRDLEGLLNRVVAATLLTGQRPMVQVAQEIVGQIAEIPTEMTLDRIIAAVADFYDVQIDELCGRGRSHQVSIARQVATYLAYREASIPLSQIGEALGGRSHSTVLYGCERVAELVATDSQLYHQVRAILQSLRQESKRLPSGQQP